MHFRLSLQNVMTFDQQLDLFTEFPESRNHVYEGCDALAVGIWHAGFEMVAQGEQVVGQVHAVVVLDGGQVRELE